MSQDLQNKLTMIRKGGCVSELLYRIGYIIECVERGFVDTFIVDGVMILKTSKHGVALLVCWDGPKEVMVFTAKELYSLWDMMLEETYED